MGSQKLWSKDFTMVVLGQIISLFGNAVLRFALPLYILEQSGSPALFGQISALSFLPMILLSPIGGIIADRVNKQRVMVVLDFLTSALILGYIFASGYTDAPALVIIFLMALYAIQGAYTPAVQSSIPLLVGVGNLVPANAAVNLVTSLSGMIGPVIGGLMYGTLGISPVLIVSCVCFFVSAVMELFIRIPHKKQEAAGGVLTVALKDMAASLRFVFVTKPVLYRAMLVMFLFEACYSSALIIGLPVLITQYLGLSSELFGITQGVMMAGGLIGGVLAGTLGKRLSIKTVPKLLLACCATLIPMLVSLFAGIPAMVSYVAITAMCFVAMGFATLMKVQIFSFVQAVTPPEITGKVFSCLIALVLCAQPIGQAVFGMLFEGSAASPWIVLLGSVVLSVAAALYSRGTFRAAHAE